MYLFSLAWFKEIFSKSMELTNVARDEPGKLDDSEDDKEDGQSLKLLNNTFSVQERIDLLQTTFTQELFKKVQMAIFEKDRKVVTYMIAMRILESENFIDRNLFEFLMAGARNVSPSTQLPVELERTLWMNSMMWADLKYLARLKPFNTANLLNHLVQNKESWDNFYERRDKPLRFADLPNRDLLDLRYFTLLDEDEPA
jgi:hypothetical protein